MATKSQAVSFACSIAARTQQRVVQMLLPFLRRLDWKGRVFLMKRYGEVRDASAEEEMIEVA